MRIRLHDTSAEVEAFTADLRQSFHVAEESSDYPDRGRSDKVRRYLDITRYTSQARTTADVLTDVAAERRRQLDKWGAQHRIDGTGDQFAAEAAQAAKTRCEWQESDSAADWGTVLLEEVWEALAEEDPAALRAELVQVAAVAAAWIEDIDHRSA